MRRHQTKSLAFTAILVAFGILIPLVMPVKVVIGPASFTLASHVPVFMAMFISPQVAVLVALGTSLGFLLAGFPIVIVLRAVSHLLFAVVGAVMIKKRPTLLEKPVLTFGLAIFLNILHGLAEFIVVLALTAGAHTGAAYIWSLVGLIFTLRICFGNSYVIKLALIFQLMLNRVKGVLNHSFFGVLFFLKSGDVKK